MMLSAERTSLALYSMTSQPLSLATRLAAVDLPMPGGPEIRQALSAGHAHCYTFEHGNKCRLRTNDRLVALFGLAQSTSRPLWTSR